MCVVCYPMVPLSDPAVWVQLQVPRVKEACFQALKHHLKHKGQCGTDEVFWQEAGLSASTQVSGGELAQRRIKAILYDFRVIQQLQHRYISTYFRQILLTLLAVAQERTGITQRRMKGSH